MAQKPDLSNILSLLGANEDFSSTEKQYLKSTGTTMPKDSKYLKRRSAVAKLAKEQGYVIEIAERTISFKKVV